MRKAHALMLRWGIGVIYHSPEPRKSVRLPVAVRVERRLERLARHQRRIVQQEQVDDHKTLHFGG